MYADKAANAVEEEPDPAKIDAITKMPMPTDKAGVQHCLGMCNYLSKFCHNLSETVLPLRDLTKENSTFLWSNNHENAFNSAKNLIASVTALCYYDPTLPVTLQVDASQQGPLLNAANDAQTTKISIFSLVQERKGTPVADYPSAPAAKQE